GAFELFGWEVGVARSVVLAFSALLVFAVYDCTRLLASRTAGPSAAHAGGAVSLAFLLLASSFAGLRVSVMIGIPALALAAFAFWAALRSQDSPERRRAWVALAGMAFAASLSTKLFTAFLLPLLLGCILQPELRTVTAVARRAKTLGALARGCALPLLFFAAGFALMLSLTMAPAMRAEAWSQLYLTHAKAEGAYKSQYTVGVLLSRDWLLYVMAGLGSLALIAVRGARIGLWFSAWLGLGALVLSRHTPLWAHHNQLMIVPAAVLAGCAVALVPALVPWSQFAARSVGFARSGAVLTGVALALAGLFAVSGERAELLLQPYGRSDAGDRAALKKLQELGVRADGYMVSSRQIYAFYLGVPVPPTLSVTSAKRFRSGHLDASILNAEIRRHRARVVVMSQRWPKPVRDSVRRSLGAEYELIYQDRKNQDLAVYRLRDDAASGRPSLTAEAR
ncbi:MAG TPA: hypothetical protein VFQ61_14185, partial [Polyangiaceae bacterium]|nr:hypothetical protein [Polyangiaceae bacterium]